MKPVHFIIVFVMIIVMVAVTFIIAMPGVEKGNQNSSGADTDRLENKVKDLDLKVAELERQLALMDTERITTTILVQDLGTKVRGIEKKLGPDAETINEADDWDESETAAVAARDGIPISKGVETELVAKIKEEIRQDLKEEERAKRLEQEKKKREGTRKWMTGAHEKHMEGFGELAQKIGLSASEEEGVRRIAKDSFERIMTIVDEAFAQSESEGEEFDWGPPKREIGEINEETGRQIEELVTEEQARQIGEYFGNK